MEKQAEVNQNVELLGEIRLAYNLKRGMPVSMKRIFLTVSLILIVIIISFFFVRSIQAMNKLSSFETNGTSEIEQIGPAWYNSKWKYRLPIRISSNTSISYYQVLIELNATNFNFSHVKNDGSDIRFTTSTGTLLIPFWIESWDKLLQHAYIWVLVPGLFAEPDKTIIYLYYGNPAATTTSDASLTFIDLYEDDWCGFPGSGCTRPETLPQSRINDQIQNIIDFSINNQSNRILSTPWITFTGMTSVVNGILNIPPGTGITTEDYIYGPNIAVGYRLKFGLGSGNKIGGFYNRFTGLKTVIAETASDDVNLYLVNYYNSENKISLGNVDDWHSIYHNYEVRWSNLWSEGVVDHTINKSSSSQVPVTSLPVSFLNETSSVATLMVDWVYVRQYQLPEPTPSIDINKEQGLVDLSINFSDNPDPLPKGQELSYPITVTNTSSIEAPGVVMTDTLPVGVNFIRTEPSSGCTHTSTKVVCNLDLIGSNLTRSVTVVVTPIVENGYITNTVTIGSPNYELDLSNNTKRINTLVDSSPPNVNWEKPVHNSEKYLTNGGYITLEASATDNDWVSQVEFWYWNHLPPMGKVSIGIDSTYPYQYEFNSEVLATNEEYQVFVQAKDRAGNESSIYTPPYPVIYVTRFFRYYTYLPLAIK